MPYREQPLTRVGGPAQYPEPDWDEIAKVTRGWVPDDETVGYAVLQGDERLAWLSAAGPESLGYDIRARIAGLLREGAGRAPGRAVGVRDALGDAAVDAFGGGVVEFERRDARPFRIRGGLGAPGPSRLPHRPARSGKGRLHARKPDSLRDVARHFAELSACTSSRSSGSISSNISLPTLMPVS